MSSVDSKKVRAFLLDNPSWILEQKDVLQAMVFPVHGQKTSSLLGYQNALLASSLKECQTSFSLLREFFEKNTEIFRATNHLLLDLIEANTPKALAQAITQSYATHFGLKASIFWQHAPKNSALSKGIPLLSVALPEPNNGAFAHQGKQGRYLGNISKKTGQALFKSDVQSICASFLSVDGGMLVLVAGALEADYYSPEMDTLAVRILEQSIMSLLQKMC